MFFRLNSKVMHLSSVLPLLITLTLFTTLESKIDWKLHPNINNIKSATWETGNHGVFSSSPVSFCGKYILPNNGPNVKKSSKGKMKAILDSFTYPNPLTIEVRIVHNSTGKSHTTTTSTYKTVYLPSNLPVGEDYEYVEPTAETMEDSLPETTSQKKSNEKKEKLSATATTTTVGTVNTNAFVGKELMITERCRRYVRNPFDFNLRYMLYPMNPDFFLAMEQSRLAETEVRNQQYLKKPDAIRSRRKINYYSNPNLRWRGNFDRRPLRSRNYKINQLFL
ncbi:unnamed protein product [Nezara viridula]|uniref:Uncharacterized protein n=1 Tax=Nezara viridula TaxID=85310 RepID=A0A9P0HTH8_NEZVI|nr:unnamed protein product [Nezara viridula]